MDAKVEHCNINIYGSNKMRFSSVSRINCLFFISALKTGEEFILQDTWRDLSPLLQEINLIHSKHEVQSKLELVQLLEEIAKLAEAGALPIIHFLAHGAPGGGIFIPTSNEMLYWDELCDALQKINISTDNNLCVVSSACFSLQVIEDIKITRPVPFYMLVAPEGKITFKYSIQSTVNFYKAIFSGEDMIEAFEKYSSEQMKIFHSEKMFAVVLAKYIYYNCRGDGKKKRIDHLVELALEGGKFADTPSNRGALARLAEERIEPTQDLIDRYASVFLLGKKAGIELSELMQFVSEAESQSTEEMMNKQS